MTSPAFSAFLSNRPNRSGAFEGKAAMQSTDEVAPGVARKLYEHEVVAAFPEGGKTKMYEAMAEGRWPRPVKGPGRRKCWFADEVRAAQERYRAERDATPFKKQPMSPALKKAIRNSVRARKARGQKRKRRAKA